MKRHMTTSLWALLCTALAGLALTMILALLAGCTIARVNTTEATATCVGTLIDNWGNTRLDCRYR